LLDQSIRTAILALHRKGLGIKAIARAMKLSRGAVRDVIRSGTAEVPRRGGVPPDQPSRVPWAELLKRTFEVCAD
jgi:hypothetical protein